MLDETTGSRMQSASLHEALRQALKAGDFDAARQLSDALGFAIVRELEAALPTAVPSLFGQRIALLEENLSLARVLRAHLASQLQINTAVVLYQPAASDAYSWGFDA